MQIGISLSINSATQGGLDPAAVSLIAAMNVQPSAARTRVINTAISQLKLAGLWAKIGLLYVTAAHAEQAGRLNWANPGTATLTAVNSPTFTADRGFTGDGSTSYLDSGIAHNAIPNFLRDAAHAAVWAYTGTGVSTLGILGSTSLQINTATTRGTRINSATVLSTTSEATTGHVVAVRRDSSNEFSYRNGGTELTVAAASASLLSTGFNFVGLRSSGSMSSSGISALHAGDQLTAAQVAALYNILRTYMTAVGVP